MVRLAFAAYATIVCLWILCVISSESISPIVVDVVKAQRTVPSWKTKQNPGPADSTSEPSKYIVVAADATAAYAFYLPMTVRLWQEVAGYGAIVLLVGPEWRNQRDPTTRVVLGSLAATSAQVHIVDVPPGSYTLSTVAQISRLLAALALPLPDETFLLVVDVDIWPLDAQHFAPKQPTSYIHIFDAFCCGAKPVDWRGFKTRNDTVEPDVNQDWYRVYPAGKGVGMSVRTWRAVMHAVLPASAASSSPPWSDFISTGSRLAALTFAVIDDNLGSLAMGKLGASNRVELEFSGLYTYGQVEWELDQRLLGLAVKRYRACPARCHLEKHDPGTLLDRISWPDADSTSDAALSGFLLAHLPMPGRDRDQAATDAGYGPRGWSKVRWLLDQLAATSSVTLETVNNLTVYRETFQDKLADAVSAVVVSLADPSMAKDAAELAALLEAQFGRSVRFLLFACGLDTDQLRLLALSRNVILASIQAEVTAGLPSVLDLRLHVLTPDCHKHVVISTTSDSCRLRRLTHLHNPHQYTITRFPLSHNASDALMDAVSRTNSDHKHIRKPHEQDPSPLPLTTALQALRESMAHPHLRDVRVHVFIAPSVRVCSGALQFAVDVANQLPAGRFLPRVGQGCSQDVQAYRADGDAWAQIKAALERGAGVIAGDGPGCVPVPGGGFVLQNLNLAPPGLDDQDAGYGCGGRLDAVTSPFAGKKLVVSVETDGHGWGKLLVTTDTTPCAFRRFTNESTWLADAVLATRGKRDADDQADGQDTCRSDPWWGGAGGVLRLNLRVAGNESEQSIRACGVSDGEVVVDGVEGDVVYGDAWVAASVCNQIITHVAASGKKATTKAKLSAALSHDSSAPDGVTVVTAAGRNYFGCLRNLVGSVQMWGEGRPLLVYDLGLSRLQRREAEGWLHVVVRDVTWGRYPPHVGQLGTYAWKILLWREALDVARAVAGAGAGVVWVDACSELRRPVGELVRRLDAKGYLLTVGGEETEWNVQRDSKLTDERQVARLLRLRANLSSVSVAEGKLYKYRGVHCLAGLVGLRGDSDAAATFTEMLVRCALDSDCIAPVGSSLSNHRFEQAALSVAAQLLGMSCDDDPRLRAYLRPDGTPSLPLPPDPRQPADVFVLARRRHPVKPFAPHVQSDVRSTLAQA